MISTSLRPTPQRPQESLTIRVKASTFLFILLLFMMLVLGAALTGFIAYFAGWFAVIAAVTMIIIGAVLLRFISSDLRSHIFEFNHENGQIVILHKSTIFALMCCRPSKKVVTTSDQIQYLRIGNDTWFREDSPDVFSNLKPNSVHCFSLHLYSGTTIRSECEMPLSDIQRIMLFVYHYNGAAYAQRRAEDIFTNTSLLLTGFEPPEGDERDKELMASKNKQKQKMSRNDKTGNKEPKRIIPLFYESDYDLA